MDIWLTICRKTVPACSHCGEPIKLGEVMVAGRLWRTSKEGGTTRRWVKNLRWHAQKGVEADHKEVPATESRPMAVCCWLEAGLAYLRDHPVAETRGRKQLQLTKKQKEERLKILRQRARLVQELKTLMEAPLDGRDTDKVIKIGSKIEELKERIEPLGGVPKSWE